MKSDFKAHPFMMYYFIKPFLFVFVIPVIKGIIQYIFFAEITGVLFLETIFLSILFIFALLRLLAFKIRVDADSLVIEKGIFVKTRCVIARNAISSISADRNLFDFLFGAVTFNINTEAGRPNSPDFRLKLSVSDAKRLYSLLYNEKKSVAMRFSHIKVAAVAAATSSAVTGLVLGVPIINQAGKMLGLSLSDLLLNKISGLSHRINTYTPPIVNIITIIALAAYGFSFLISFFRYIGFSLNSSDEQMEIRSGFFVRKHTVFKKKSVNDVLMEQTPLMRLFHTFSLCVSVAGYGDAKKERAIAVPCGQKRQIKTLMKAYFPDLCVYKTCLKAPRNYRNGRRFLFVPTLLSVLVVLSAIIEGLMFPAFISLVLFLNSIFLIVIVYYGNLCLKDYRTARISFGENIFAASSVGLSRREMYCKREKIGVIKISRTPADRKYNTCKIKLFVCSESSDSIRIKNIDYLSVLENIEKCYEIDGITSKNGGKLPS